MPRKEATQHSDDQAELSYLADVAGKLTGDAIELADQFDDLAEHMTESASLDSYREGYAERVDALRGRMYRHSRKISRLKSELQNLSLRAPPD